MLNRISFQPALASGIDTQRSDVACFIGYVARRSHGTVPDSVIEQLSSDGWQVGMGGGPVGPWSVPGPRLDALLELPVRVDSWALFDHLFAWEQRPLQASSSSPCASYLGAAVRSFFAQGGRRAVVVRVGDPWPFLDGERLQRRDQRLAGLLPCLETGTGGASALEPIHWRGIEHLHGLPDVSQLCVPDLSDCCAIDPLAIRPADPPMEVREVFIDCGDGQPIASERRDDRILRTLDVPRLDREGFQSWQSALAEIARFLASHRRDVLFVGHLPQAEAATSAGDPPFHASSDPHGFLCRTGLWQDRTRPDTTAPATKATATESGFLQLVWPWLRGSGTVDLPAHLQPADGLLAGLLARNALLRGTHRSIAGLSLAQLGALDPLPAVGPDRDGPTARLAERVCLIGPGPAGFTLLSDVTTSAQQAWRSGGVSRMMSSLWRAARRVGESTVFEPNGPSTWALVRRRLEAKLTEFWRQGALGGRTTEESFSVRCDRETMSQSDLDQGRIRAEVGVLPAMGVERITVVLALADGRAQSPSREVV